RRTHDMNTANWIPDLFMKRVMENGEWTLFSPSDVPDLHDKYGRTFERAYIRYEEKVAKGELKLYKRIPATQLWRKMLSMLFETGHPWITFKDPCNLRSPQRHVGVVHSSNLCTEITLNTSRDEIAVCNLGSVNLVAHMTDAGLDFSKLKDTIRTAMRMLDNVIDINYYAVKKARDSNQRHRPVGLGIMGFQDCLHRLRIPYASQEAMEFADRSMEMVAYAAYWASTELAEERGRYSTFPGSLWDRGILPPDTLDLLAAERGGYVELDRSSSLDWAALRRLYATAFEVEPKWLVEAGARRQKWIDQSQSLNIYMAGASGKKLDETYKLAWIRGLKTTYYLRAMGATHAEKSTSKAGQLNAVPAAGGIQGQSAAGEAKFCAVETPD